MSTSARESVDEQAIGDGFVEVLYPHESTTARGHHISVHAGEQYKLLNDVNVDWWYVSRADHTEDGFYLPRTYVKKIIRDSKSAVVRPTSMTLPANFQMLKAASIQTNGGTSSFRKSTAGPGFWLAANAVPARSADLHFSVHPPPSDDVGDIETTDVQSKHANKARTPVRVDPVHISDSVLNAMQESMTKSCTSDDKHVVDDVEDRPSVASSDSDEASPSKLSTLLERMQPVNGHSPDSAISTNDPTLELIQHNYANSDMLMSLTRRPPQPSADDVPVKQLGDEWAEYIERESERTYFYHRSTGFSTWKPPRGLIAPKQVEKLMSSSGEDSSEMFDYDSSTSVEEHRNRSITAAAEGNKFAPTPPSASHKPKHLISSLSGDSGRTDELPATDTPQGTALQVRNRSFAGQVKDRASQYDAFNSSVQAAQIAGSLRRAPTLDLASLRAHNTTVSLAAQHAFQQTTVKRGQMDKCKIAEAGKPLKKQWITCYVFLTSAHMIFYKDEKASEKRGQHYPTPLGVCDLRGARLSWGDADKKHTHVLQIELADDTVYGFSGGDTQDINSWYHAVRQVIARLPVPEFYPRHSLLIAPNKGANKGVHAPVTGARIDDPVPVMFTASTSLTAAVAETSAAAAVVPAPKDSPRKQRLSFTSRVPPIDTKEVVEPVESGETSAQRGNILERLRRFFRTRPTLESLKEKGIYKPEPVFGSSLVEICKRERSSVPRFIRRCTAVIEERGLDADGLYRISGNLSAVQKIRCQVDQDKYSQLDNEPDIHVVTGALKLFFRELQEPVFTMGKDLLAAIRIQKPKQRAKEVGDLLHQMPAVHYETLRHLFAHLLRVAQHSGVNRMQIHNLSIVFGPTLFSSSGGPAASKTDKKRPPAKTAAQQQPAASSATAGSASNSHLAFNMIMQGNIIEYMLTEYDRFFGSQPLANAADS